MSIQPRTTSLGRAAALPAAAEAAGNTDSAVDSLIADRWGEAAGEDTSPAA